MALAAAAMVIACSQVLAAQWAVACPIPVFQYALEHWNADPYEVVVHHDGALTESQQAVVERLQDVERGKQEVANITLLRRDHSRMETPVATVRTLPYVEVRYPAATGIRPSLAQLDLTDKAVSALLDSPARRVIAEHLLQRKTAVWVLLESNDRQANVKALQTLRTELTRLKKTLQVADPGEEKALELGKLHTEIDFTIVRLRRDDPREQHFIAMLLGSERDLNDFEDQPIAFPIYGRGIALYALIGRGINPRTLQTAGEFLVGPCSCQVKSGNPGVDLLMSVDWDGKVEPQSRISDPPTAGLDGFFERLEGTNQGSSQ
ncbi:MAG: hypothetical protein WD030_02090 [Pirellulales bacterium]